MSFVTICTILHSARNLRLFVLSQYHEGFSKVQSTSVLQLPGTKGHEEKRDFKHYALQFFHSAK